ncbi:MAG: hypothetical protein JRI23_01135, partial [Deltaproteobacteria bacterium]|nr:hypothetical protein [Deltaproteobacteria bacterium]MBW2530058.1 hypothetical protein [Deltaproteobacteria bacterium]
MHRWQRMGAHDSKTMALAARKGLAVGCLLSAAVYAGAAGAQPSIGQHTQTFDTEKPIAPTLRWTKRTSGLCGQKCRNGPRHMYSAAFGDTFLMSWMAIDEMATGESMGWVQYGNASTFQVSVDGEFTHVDTVSFQDTCEAVYGMTSTADGSLIAILCRGYPGPEGSLGAELLPGATDLLDTVRDADCDTANIRSCYPIGHYCPSASPLYIFEYEAPSGSSEPARVSDSPTRMIRVNHAVGGWRYGHHEFTLNEGEDTYFLALKVVSNGCDHEGLKHFGVRRAPNVEYVKLTDEWACSGGHTEGNRLAYNQARDFWSILCTNDLCDHNDQFVSGRCRGVDVSTVPGTSYQGGDGPGYHEGEELLALEVWDTAWNLPGGGAAIVSLGQDGWMALAPAPDGSSPNEERLKEARALGLINLPVDGADLASLGTSVQVPTYEGGDPFPVGEVEVFRYDWQWLALPDARDGSSPRFGFANLAYFDTQSEDSERLLLGWSPATRTQGITDEYVVSEVDRQGQLRGEPLTLDGAGWGEDNRWVTMPTSGCVVFPFAWAGDSGPGQDYPLEGQEPTAYPTVMHLTSLCPVGDQPPPADAGQGPSPYDASPDGAAAPSGTARDTDSGCGCRAPATGEPKGLAALA